MVKTIFLTNDEDQNSVACEMPTTLTVTYAVIVACVIETRTVFNPARSLIHHCSDPLAGLSSLAGNRARVAAFRGSRAHDNLQGWEVCLRVSLKQAGDSLRLT